MQSMDSCVAPLSSRALGRVSGPDWRPFLQGLLTQDVETLAPGELRCAALLTPQGPPLFDLFVLQDGEAALLDVAADRRDALVQRLSMYRLRAKVEIGHDEGAWAAWPAVPEGWLVDPRLEALGGRAYGAAPAPPSATEADYQAWRLSLGVPAPAADCQPDRAYTIEAGFG